MREILRDSQSPFVNALDRSVLDDVQNFTYVIDAKTQLLKKAGNVIVVPAGLRRRVLQIGHDANGHIGCPKTIAFLKERFWWKGMDLDVFSWISNCPTCQMAKGNPEKKAGKYTNWESSFFNECIHLDVAGPLPVTSAGNVFVLGIRDRYTGYFRSVAMPTTFSTRCPRCGTTYLDIRNRITAIEDPISSVG